MPFSGNNHQLMDFLYRIYSRQTPDDLVTVLLDGLPGLIAGDNVMVGLHNAEARKIHGLALRHPFSHMNFLFEANESGLIAHHPFWDRILVEKDPLKILSEMTSAQTWRDNPVYRDVLAADRVEDHLNIEFGPSRSAFTTISVIRSRRGFGERDRQLLLLLRPHLVQAFENARMVERANERGLGGDGCSVCEALVDGQGVVRAADPEGEAHFRQWFGDQSPARPAFDRWLSEEVRHLNQGGGYGASFCFNAGLASYRAALRRRWSGGDYTLFVFRDDPAPATPSLTARETDMLFWLRQGKTNADIANIAGLSVYTVKQHLKKIYRKLGVENRTAAAFFTPQGTVRRRNQ